jgi:hypothetical protein
MLVSADTRKRMGVECGLFRVPANPEREGREYVENPSYYA